MIKAAQMAKINRFTVYVEAGVLWYYLMKLSAEGMDAYIDPPSSPFSVKPLFCDGSSTHLCLKSLKKDCYCYCQ